MFILHFHRSLNLRGVSTKLNKYIVFTMQTYKELIRFILIWHCEFKFRSRQQIFRCSLQCQANMNLVFHISDDSSEIGVMGLSDLLQGCSNMTDTVMIWQYCYCLVLSTLWRSFYSRSVSKLSGQTSNKFDIPILHTISMYILSVNVIYSLFTDKIQTIYILMWMFNHAYVLIH